MTVSSSTKQKRMEGMRERKIIQIDFVFKWWQKSSRHRHTMSAQRSSIWFIDGLVIKYRILMNVKNKFFGNLRAPTTRYSVRHILQVAYMRPSFPTRNMNLRWSVLNFILHDIKQEFLSIRIAILSPAVLLLRLFFFVVLLRTLHYSSRVGPGAMLWVVKKK